MKVGRGETEQTLGLGIQLFPLGGVCALWGWGIKILYSGHLGLVDLEPTA